jgi:hypothetical protein
LAGQWPLPVDVAIPSYLTDSGGSRFYSKAKNVEVAARMSVSDVESSDLGRILLDICDLASRLRKG